MKPASLDHQQPSSTSSLPDSRLTLPPDTQSQIVDLFIAGHMDLATIAGLCNVTFTQLIDFLESPRITARLDAIQRLCERRAAIMAAEARCVALARLRAIAEHQPESGFTPPKLFTRELETTRKAAAQLLRVPPTCPQVGAHDAPTDPAPPTKPAHQEQARPHARASVRLTQPARTEPPGLAFPHESPIPPLPFVSSPPRPAQPSLPLRPRSAAIEPLTPTARPSQARLAVAASGAARAATVRQLPPSTTH